VSTYPFIAIEGQDGVGKTTLRKSLFQLLGNAYDRIPLSVLTVNYVDYRVARALIEGKYSPSPENRDAYLDAIIADKRASLDRLVRPALADRPVLADRWLLSEMVFCYVRHAMELADTYTRVAPHLELAADVTLLLELDAESSHRRAGQRSGEATRPDWDIPDVQERVRVAYRNAAEHASEFPLLGVVRSIESDQPREAVLRAAWKALADAEVVPRRRTDSSHALGGVYDC